MVEPGRRGIHSILAKTNELFFLSLMTGFGKEFSVFMLSHLFPSFLHYTTQKNHLPFSFLYKIVSLYILKTEL